MKLLVVKMSSLGDVIHTLPALDEALAAIPDLVVDWAVEPAFADVVRLHGGVRHVWLTPVRHWRKHLLAGITWRAIRQLRADLRRERYDVVLDAQGLAKSAVVALLAGRPVSGLDRRSARGGRVAALYARRHAVSTALHAIDRTRLLFGAALGYDPAPGGAAAPLAPPAHRASPDHHRTAFLIHGTTWPSKAWPLAQWIGLSRGLVQRGYRPVLTYASAAEMDLATAVASAVAGCEVVGHQPLADVAARIAASALVVGVDTGLTHLAAALGRPTVALFASTAPGLTAPRGPEVAVLAATIACAPCRKRTCPLVPPGTDPPCHATIGPSRVLDTVDTWSRQAIDPDTPPRPVPPA